MPSDVKRFILLGGATYYACGGFHDFISSHDLFIDAIDEGNRCLNNNGSLLSATYDSHTFDWFHVWDCTENKVVAVSELQAHGAEDETPAMEEQPHAR